MAGGRKLDSISEIRARMGSPAFDQHPRHTAPLLAPDEQAPLVVVGGAPLLALDEQAPLVVVGGRHDRQGWRVLLLRGGVCEAALEPAAARALAEQLHQMADVCDGGRW